MNKFLFGLLVFLVTLLAQGGRAWGAPTSIYIPSLGANATGTTVGAKKTLDVSIPAGLSITDPAEGLTGAAAPTTGILVGGSDGTNLRGLHVDAAGDLQTDRTWTLNSGTDSCSAVQSGTWNINNISGTVSLPTGASTAANQSTANTSLASIDGKITAVNTGAVVISSSALPSGAATSANQGTEITSLSSIDTKLSSQATAANQSTANTSLSSIDTKASTINTSIGTMSAKLPAALGQTTASGSLSVVLASDQASVAGRTYLTSVRNAYPGTNVTTGAWVQLIASTSGVANEIEIFDSSGQTLELGTGAAASEARVAIIFPGGNGRIPLKIASGTRVSVRAVSATASVGELDINFYQ